MTALTLLFALALGQAQPAATSQRFDYLVRADFFAGVAGDEVRLRKAIDLCEHTLAMDPQHPEALVWHGASLLVQGGQAFQKGEMSKGGPLVDRGLKEMSDAVMLSPDNPGVLIPRAAVLLEASRNMPPEMARPLVMSALANYEHALTIQAPYFATLGDHGKGEILFGLAEGYARLGQADNARRYFERLINEAPTSGQLPKARQWMTDGTIPKANGTSCVGCHK
jgi:tetratricopeptide (TPR) repeat protein